MMIVRFLWGLFVSFAIIYSASASDFIDGFEDIPLMKRLYQSDGQNFSFGNEESGYTEAVLIGKKGVKFSEVSAFYLETLSHLGWLLDKKEANRLIFQRDSNILEISKQKENPLTLSINLKSKN